MNKVADRAKMRREYLRKKAGIVFLWFFGGAIVTLCSILGLFFLALFCIGNSSANLRNICFICFVVLGIATVAGRWVFLYSVKKSHSLPYVPSVHEHIGTLPAAEVLLRGSQASPVPREELLRPVVGRQTQAEELLRATGDEKC